MYVYASYPEKLCVFIVEIHISFVYHTMKQSKATEEKWKEGAASKPPNSPHWESAYTFKLLLEPTKRNVYVSEMRKDIA